MFYSLFSLLIWDKIKRSTLPKYPLDHKSKGIKHFLECVVGGLKAPEGVDFISYSCMYLQKGELEWMDGRLEEKLNQGIQIHQAMLQILEEQK